jgi:hypothetical protein
MIPVPPIDAPIVVFRTLRRDTWIAIPFLLFSAAW